MTTSLPVFEGFEQLCTWKADGRFSPTHYYLLNDGPIVNQHGIMPPIIKTVEVENNKDFAFFAIPGKIYGHMQPDVIRARPDIVTSLSISRRIEFADEKYKSGNIYLKTKIEKQHKPIPVDKPKHHYETRFMKQQTRIKKLKNEESKSKVIKKYNTRLAAKEANFSKKNQEIHLQNKFNVLQDNFECSKAVNKENGCQLKQKSASLGSPSTNLRKKCKSKAFPKMYFDCEDCEKKVSHHCLIKQHMQTNQNSSSTPVKRAGGENGSPIEKCKMQQVDGGDTLTLDSGDQFLDQFHHSDSHYIGQLMSAKSFHQLNYETFLLRDHDGKGHLKPNKPENHVFVRYLPCKTEAGSRSGLVVCLACDKESQSLCSTIQQNTKIPQDMIIKKSKSCWHSIAVTSQNPEILISSQKMDIVSHFRKSTFSCLFLRKLQNLWHCFFFTEARSHKRKVCVK